MFRTAPEWTKQHLSLIARFHNSYTVTDTKKQMKNKKAKNNKDNIWNWQMNAREEREREQEEREGKSAYFDKAFQLW